MMDGINILSLVERTTYKYDFITPVGFVVLACIAILVIIGIYLICNNKREDYQALGCVIIISSLVLGSQIFMISNLVPDRSYTEYKVTIDDSVSFTEFNNRYRILSSEGKIYTIIERQQVSDIESDIE